MAEGNFISLGQLLKVWMTEIIMALRKSLEDDNAIATRNLIQSITAEIKVYGHSFTIEFTMDDYWKNIEYGQKPGTLVPIEALEKWVTVKGLAKPSSKFKSMSKYLTKKTYGTLRKERVLNLKNIIAKRVQSSILKRGTYPRHSFGVVFNEKLEHDLEARIREAVGKDINVKILEMLPKDLE